MASDNERFFQRSCFAVVANTDLGPFPIALVAELREAGKTVHPVDYGGSRYVQGDEAFPSLLDLPVRVDGAIVDLPRHKHAETIEQAIAAKISTIWLQSGTSPQVQKLCTERNVALHVGDARLYTRQGFSLGKLFAKLSGKY